MSWNDLTTQFQYIVDNPGQAASVILILIVIESLLSIDNAAVLATMVMDLPKEQKNKALKYGIIGAYVFRGLAIVFASFLIKLWYLKPLGGLYLLYLVWDWWKGKQTETKEDDYFDKKGNWLYKITVGSLGNFWATVALVELMDMAFSIDNVVAVTALSSNLIIVWTGVFIGILAMRFVAQAFVKLMEKYPFLDTCAFIVIAILGLKLALSTYTHFQPCTRFSLFLEGERACLESKGITPPAEHTIVWGDVVTSGLTIGIFLIPILFSLFSTSRQKNVEPS
jgi:YkoY family integral membrane protein